MSEQAEYELLSEPEKIVQDWLVKWDIPFRKEVPFFGGRVEMGGTYVDFLLDEQMVAIRVQGVYWHSGIIPQAQDTFRKEKLQELGYIVVDIWEDALVDKTQDEINYVMRLALEGQELPR